MKAYTLLFAILFAINSVHAHQPGDLDPTFGDGGKVITAIGDEARAVAIQPDGKIVAAGLYNQGSILARYTIDGSLDTSFGSDGTVVIPEVNANSVVIQTDGKIVTGGSVYENANWYFGLLRYNANGSLDTSFGGNGKVVTTFGSNWVSIVGAITIQTDGKIVAAGSVYNGTNRDFALVRYNADGSLDTSFDGDGQVLTNFSGSSDGGTLSFDEATAVAIRSDGKIVVAGYSASSSYDFAMVRYHADGSVDTSFGSGGKVTTPIGVHQYMFSGGVNSIAIRSDGRILAGGRYSYYGYCDPDYPFDCYDPHGGDALVSYNSNGSIDTSFGSGGTVNSGSYSVAIQSDGKIIAAGSGSLARYNSNGSLDSTFGGGDGISTVPFPVQGMALDGQGRAVGVGASDGAFAIARFLLDSKRTPFDYDGDGKSDFSVWRPSDGTWYLGLSSTGAMNVQPWGAAGDKIVPADFDNDRVTDMAVYRPSEGKWYVINSATASLNTIQFGLNGDVPLPQDFDGDGKADFGIWRPSDGTWYLGLTESSSMYVLPFGLSTDKPVPADYDGDGKSEIAVWRPSEGRWYVGNIATGAFGTFDWGLNGDMPVVGDFSGDGKSDYTVYRPSNQTWYRIHTDDFQVRERQWGIASDIPAPGDFDGDGKLDLAVFRPSEGKWYVLTATSAQLTQTFGLNGDLPTESAFVY